jgi:hypothetical protein
MAIIKISDHSNIGSDYRNSELIILLTILIIDYRTALVFMAPRGRLHLRFFMSVLRKVECDIDARQQRIRYLLQMSQYGHDSRRSKRSVTHS